MNTSLLIMSKPRASRLRAAGHSAAAFVADQLERTRQLLKFTGAETPEQFYDRRLRQRGGVSQEALRARLPGRPAVGLLRQSPSTCTSPTNPAPRRPGPARPGRPARPSRRSHHGERHRRKTHEGRGGSVGRQGHREEARHRALCARSARPVSRPCAASSASWADRAAVRLRWLNKQGKIPRRAGSGPGEPDLPRALGAGRSARRAEEDPVIAQILASIRSAPIPADGGL